MKISWKTYEWLIILDYGYLTIYEHLLCQAIINSLNKGDDLK